MTEQVLAHSQCNACTENGMLLATIMQQLSTTVTNITTCLPFQKHLYKSREYTQWRQNCRFSTQRPQSSDVKMIDTSGSVFDSSNNNDPARNTSDLFEETIFFGRYKVDSPEIRL